MHYKIYRINLKALESEKPMLLAMSKKLLTCFILDVVCVAAIGIPVLLLYLTGKPYRRGFFCNDESIRHPFLPSTIPSSAMISISYTVPILTFFSFETFKSRANYKAVLSQTYHQSKVFGFGALSTTLLTDVAKYTIGRPRPHFIEVCNPDVVFNNATCGTKEAPKYVTNYTCRGNEKLFPNDAERRKKMKDSRLSFCSGHASLTWFSMFYTAMFLQLRLVLSERRKYMVLLKAIGQLSCVIFALYTSMSRISDYKHHPEDVLAGSVLGVLWAVVIFTWVSGIQIGGMRGVESPVESAILVSKTAQSSEHNI